MVQNSYNKILTKLMSKNTKDLNDSHIYTFTIYLDGEKIDIHVNDMLPQ